MVSYEVHLGKQIQKFFSAPGEIRSTPDGGSICESQRLGFSNCGARRLSMETGERANEQQADNTMERVMTQPQKRSLPEGIGS